MAESAGEKTEKATPKRKKDERKKGNVFSSQDLVASFTILFMFLTLKLSFNFMAEKITECLRFWIYSCGDIKELNQEMVKQILLNSLKTIAFVVGPVCIVGMVIPVLITGAQTRFIISKDALKPKFSRLNPISGLKKLFALRSLVELVKNLLKIAVITAIIYSQLKKRLVELVKLYDIDVKSAIIYLFSTIYSIVMTISIVFIFLGIADLFYQWWEYEKNLKMTKQEVKEEYKQMEGDPQIKGAIRQKQRQMSQARMMQDVKSADVVIRNPTHYAVAISYDPDKNLAPLVVAKGADYVALKIIQVASENDVVLQENKPLARALYNEVDIGSQISEEFYQPVAEVLAFVYNLKNKQIDL